MQTVTTAIGIRPETPNRTLYTPEPYEGLEIPSLYEEEMYMGRPNYDPEWEEEAQIQAEIEEWEYEQEYREWIEKEMAK
jgi:hypothetical protein